MFLQGAFFLEYPVIFNEITLFLEVINLVIIYSCPANKSSIDNCLQVDYFLLPIIVHRKHIDDNRSSFGHYSKTNKTNTGHGNFYRGNLRLSMEILFSKFHTQSFTCKSIFQVDPKKL